MFMYGCILNNMEVSIFVVLSSHCFICSSILNCSEPWTENYCGHMYFFPLWMLARTRFLSRSVSAPPQVSHSHTRTQNCYIASRCLSCNRILPDLNLVLEWIWARSVFFNLLEYEVICVLKLDHIKSRD